MKKNILIIIIVVLNFRLSATDGELWFKVIESTYWTLEFMSLENEKYYDCNFNIVSEGTILNFVFVGTPNVIAADHCCNMVGEGDLDTNGNRFTYYYGKYKVIFTWDGGSTYFYMDFKDCDYLQLGSQYYPGGDIYFKIENRQFIETNSSYSPNYGNYTEQLYEVWNDFSNLEPYKTQVTDCLFKDVTVRNLVEGSDYGSVWVNGNAIPSSQQATDLVQGYDNNFQTYSTIVSGK